MLNQAQPVIILIHGAWHRPLHLQSLAKKVEVELGLQCITPALPSVGHDPPIFDKDVETISQAIRSIVNEGRECIVVLHSYAGIPGSSALDGLSRSIRQPQGLNGGVIAVIYMPALIIPKGTTYLAFRGGQLPSTWDIKGDEALPGGDLRELFYNDLPLNEAKYYVSEILPHATRAFNIEATYEPWHDIQSYYLICENDNMIKPDLQEKLIQIAGNKIIVDRCSAGHSPFISQPDKLLQLIQRAVSENKQ